MLPWRKRTLNTPKVIGHRGNRNDAAENTLLGFRQCLDDKRIDGVELDIWLAGDALAVIHDKEASITTDGTGLITEMSEAQIKALRCRFGKRISKETVPVLEDVFELISASGREDFLLNVEIKDDAANGDTSCAQFGRAEQRVSECATNYPSVSLMVSCFDHRRLVKLKTLAPQIPTAILQEGLTAPADLVSYSKKHGFSWWALKFSSISPEVASAAKQAGIRIAAWTVDDPKEWDRLIDCGIDAIVTNRPLRLATHLEHKSVAATGTPQ
jgi:glycerophosphoryl diester phosphodiesterase